ncbi:MAG: hypothetical protein J7502_01660 [Flavisolibacter sp.]|nr:hypothetical protein [Flavisolibacter sp.]
MRSFQKLTLSSFLLTLAFGIQAQNNSQGEGVVTVVLYFRPLGDTNYSNNAAMKSYRYFIKGTKILRKDSILPQERSQPAVRDTSTFQNKKIITSFSARLVHPIYIIDLDKQQAFTFYKPDSQLHISVDTLDNHFEEVLYKPKFEKRYKEASFRFMPNILPQIIQGKTCYTAQWIYKGDSNYFRYTKEPLTVKSPLNRYLPDFPYPILSLDAKSTKYKTGEPEANVTIEITELKELKLPDDLFVIPKDAIKKYNVPSRDLNGLEFWYD